MSPIFAFAIYFLSFILYILIIYEKWLKVKTFLKDFLEKRKTARKNHESGLSHKRKGNLNDYKAIISRLLAYVKQKMVNYMALFEKAVRSRFRG